MRIRFSCANCGRRLEAEESLVGKAIRCPNCNSTFRVTQESRRDSAGDEPRRSRSVTEPSPWRNPAIYIAFVGIAALVFVFLVYHTTNYRKADAPSPTGVAPREAAAERSRQKNGLPRTLADEVVAERLKKSQPTAGKIGPDRLGQPIDNTSIQPRPAQPKENMAAQAQASELAPREASHVSAEDLFRRASPAVVCVTALDEESRPISQGSGFFVSRDGILVTNHHVVKDASAASVALPTGASFSVESVLAKDTESDLIVLKVNGRDLPHLPLTPSDAIPEVGARVYAIGNPLGLTNTFSEGIVSSIREEAGRRWLQTTTPISPGSSGGPLLDTQGRVVGVTTSIWSDEEGLSQNLNFAVPAATVHKILTEAQQRTPVSLAESEGGASLTQFQKDLIQARIWIFEKQWQKAVRTLNQLRREYPDSSGVHAAFGALHLGMGNYELAAEAYQKAVELDPDWPGGYAGLGEVYCKMERYSDSVDAYKKALSLAPEGWFFRMGLAETYTAMGAYQEAAETYKAALQLPGVEENTFSAAFTNRAIGHVYLKARRYRDSISYLKKAIRLEPDDKWSYYYLGLAYLGLGKRAEAMRAYETLQDLDTELANDLLVRLYVQGGG